MTLRSGGDQLDQGATALLLLGATAAVGAAFLPWKHTAVYLGASSPGGTTVTGITYGWGVLSVAVAVGAVALSWRRDWSTAAVPTAVAGVAIAGTALVSALVVDPRHATGTGVTLTVLAGLTVLLAGAVGAASVTGPVLPRPLAGWSVPRRLTGAVAASGALLVIAYIVLDTFAEGNVHEYSAGSWGGFAFVALVGLVGGLVAWSRPVALAAAVTGGLATATALAAQQASPPAWALDAATAPAFVVGPLFAGGLALLVPALLELGGAGRSGRSHGVRDADASAATREV